MHTKTVYLFDASTGEYKGDYQAQESPLEPNAFIEPIFSTEIAPTAAAADQVAVFSSGAWSLQPDYRGQVIYDQATGAAQEVTAIGPIPAGFALTAPAPTLAQAQATQIAIVQTSAQAAETAPLSFTTAASVTSTFPMDQISWTKYLGAYTHYVVHGQALPSPFNFYDATGRAVAFTLADISGFFNAGLAQIEGALSRQATLIAEIEAATTVSAAQAIVW